jgi:CubicO group peptidase (beta-lactamase class C family)
MKKIITTFWVIFASLTSLFAQKNQVQQRIKQVESNLIPFVPVNGFPTWNLQERMKHYGVQGVSIAVVNNFKVEWAKGYGMADTLKKQPVTTETMFSAGSISKLLMAFGAFQLVQSQQLSLDAPINNYLKSWKIPDNNFTAKTPITLRMLLSHKAGTSQQSYFGFLPEKKPLPTIIDILKGNPIAETRGIVVNSEPNKEFRYSGGGSMVAQLAVMDASNKKFEDYIDSAIFKPLNMSNSTFYQPVPEKYKSQTSWGYSAASWYKGTPYVYPQLAAAGLYSTPTDLAKFVVEIQKAYRGDGKLLNKNFAQLMTTSQVNVSEGAYREQVGIGPFLLQRVDNKEDKGIYFEFTGVNAGFTAYLIGNLTEGYGAVIMLNTGDDFNGLGKEVRRAIAKTYNWYKFLPEAISPVELPQNTLDQYTGRYRNSQNEVVYIRRQKNYLVENINDGEDIYCFPIKKDSIVFTDFNIKGGFGRNEKGEVISLQNIYQQKPVPKMKADEFSPNELLKMGRFEDAKEGLKQMNMNEYQLTYLAYETFYKKPQNLPAVKAILELGLAQFPKSSIVHNRWGDYYSYLNDKENALKSYKLALSFDPFDKETKEKIEALRK